MTTMPFEIIRKYLITDFIITDNNGTTRISYFRLPLILLSLVKEPVLFCTIKRSYWFSQILNRRFVLLTIYFTIIKSLIITFGRYKIVQNK